MRNTNCLTVQMGWGDRPTNVFS